jgi:hypothetical protein
MVERGDLTVLHEPFCNLRDYGETDAGDRTFDSPRSLLAWLRDETDSLRYISASRALIHLLQVFCPGMTGGIRVAGQRGGDIDSTC